jgi:hypothetical protein
MMRVTPVLSGIAAVALVLSSQVGATAGTAKLVSSGYAFELVDIGCESASVCFATSAHNGENVRGITRLEQHGSAARTAELSKKYILGQISCPSRAGCTVLGFNGRAKLARELIPIGHRGTLGKPLRVVGPPRDDIDAIDCFPTRTHCTVVGARVHAITIVTAAGSTMSLHRSTVPKSTGEVVLQAVACASRMFCEAVGSASHGAVSRGFLLPIRNGVPGKWSLLPDPGDGGLSGVACETKATCFAVGEVAASDGSGRAYIATISSGKLSAVTPLRHHTLLEDIDCENGHLCIAVGGVTSPTTDQQDGGLIVRIRHGVPSAPQVTTNVTDYHSVGADRDGFEAVGDGLSPRSESVVTAG